MSWFKPNGLFSRFNFYLYMLEISYIFLLKLRDNNVTCNISTPDPTETSPGGAVIQQPPLCFNVLITFTFLMMLVSI